MQLDYSDVPNTSCFRVSPKSLAVGARPIEPLAVRSAEASWFELGSKFEDTPGISQHTKGQDHE